MSAQRTHCVLFDLDGTLVDTAPDLGYAANCVRGEAGLPPLPVERYRPVASAGARGLLRVALDETPDHPAFAAHRESFLRHYRANLARASRPFPGVAGLLAALARRGVRWGVVTNKPAWLAEPLLEQLGLSAQATVIVGGVEGVPLKPAPDLLLRACAQAHLTPAECLYIGDDRRDVDAARAAGMRVIAAGWGYLGDDGDPQAWGADALIASPAEVERWL